VIALTANSTGSCVTSSFSRSMTTEVSMTPLGARGESGTRAGVLGRDLIEVVAKPGKVDARCTPEHGDCGLCRYEPVSTQGSQLSDGYAVPSHHEAFAAIESPHDLAAVVPELSLGDVSDHGNQRSTTCYAGYQPSINRFGARLQDFAAAARRTSLSRSGSSRRLRMSWVYHTRGKCDTPWRDPSSESSRMEGQERLSGAQEVRIRVSTAHSATWLLSVIGTVCETRTSSPERVTGRRSDADDVDEIAESGEVVGISGVEHQAIGVGGGEQVGRRYDRPVSATADTICP